MPNKDVHVATQGDKWTVKEEGNKQATSTHRTQSAAITAGRTQARRNQSELLVHGRNGKIRMRSTYGRDPRRSKG